MISEAIPKVDRTVIPMGHALAHYGDHRQT